MCFKDVVADIDVDIIIGLDFLRKHKCKIDVTEETLSIRDGLANLNLQGNWDAIGLLHQKQ